MYRRLLILVSFLCLTSCEIKKKAEADVEKNLMMGIDTAHDRKIDKDTIITRNLKLEKRLRGQKSPSNKNKEDREPDWTYSPFPKEVADHVTQFKRNMSECLKEVQAKDKRPVKRLSPKMESPVHGECLIACVLKRNGVILNGKINKENLILLVSKFYSKDTKLMKKLDKNLDRCIESSVRYQDECQLASHLNDCTNDLMMPAQRKLSARQMELLIEFAEDHRDIALGRLAGGPLGSQTTRQAWERLAHRLNMAPPNPPISGAESSRWEGASLGLRSRDAVEQRLAAALEALVELVREIKNDVNRCTRHS